MSGARTGGVGARASDLVHALPLVDEQSLVSVLEPRQVREPLEVAGHRVVVKEEASEQHEGNDDRRAYRQRHRHAARNARDQVPEAGRDVGHEHDDEARQEEAGGLGVEPYEVVG